MKSLIWEVWRWMLSVTDRGIPSLKDNSGGDEWSLISLREPEWALCFPNRLIYLSWLTSHGTSWGSSGPAVWPCVLDYLVNIFVMMIKYLTIS